jgi:endonuclease/exonuclease/phosphatase family metal-dependent hydrolase
MRIAGLFIAVIATALLQSPLDVRASEAERIRVLSYNVHGFWMRGHPLGSEERSQAIGGLLGGYDVVMLQEDWEYHDLLAEPVEWRAVERGNGARDHWALSSARILTFPLRLVNSRSRMPYGSGLSVLVRELEPVPEEVTREYLGACHGWLGYANDCLASKGFLRVRVRLSDGGEIDLYDTHLDAGTDEADRAARWAQLRRWATRIRELSADRALILGGDFNSRYADENGTPRSGLDWEALRSFREALGLDDARAAPDPENGWEDRIDYVLYRSSDRVKLRVVESGEDHRFFRDGHPLSDHPAIFADFEVRVLDGEERAAE